MNLDDYRHRLDPLLVERDHAARRAREERESLGEAEANLAAATEAQAILQTVAVALQNLAHDRIAAVVTRCLRTVGFDYDFKIAFEAKRGKTEAKLSFVKGGVEHDPLKMSGGGAVDVAAFALRLVTVMLTVPQPRRLLILDEPFSRVRGEAHQDKIPLLLKALASELGFQFVVVAPVGGCDFTDVGKVVEI